MKDPTTYLSASEGTFRVIHQALPIGPNVPTPGAALEVAHRFKLRVDERAWDGDAGAWVPLSTIIVPCDKCGKPNDRADEGNYCASCADAYRKRVGAEYETRPVEHRTKGTKP